MSAGRENFSNENESRGNVWSAGSRGGFRGNYSRPDNDENRSRGRGSYRGSFQNNYPRRGSAGGNYGFRRSNDDGNDGGEVELMKDVIFVQNLPKSVTRDEIHDAFSTVGPVKINERSGGPKIWIYKDRMTGDCNGRATVTYEDEETAQKAIAEYNDQHIGSLDCVVRVQLAQRRSPRYNNDRGGFQNNRGFRGGRNNDDYHQNYSSDGMNNRGGRGFRGRGRGGDRGRSFYRGNSSFSGNRGGASGSGSPPY